MQLECPTFYSHHSTHTSSISYIITSQTSITLEDVHSHKSIQTRMLLQYIKSDLLCHPFNLKTLHLYYVNFPQAKRGSFVL